MNKFSSARKDSGNVLFYVFIAVALMAALTYAYVKDSREGLSTQTAARTAEDLFVQTNMIRAAIQQCAMEYPQGGGDLNGDGVVDTTDNPNNPFPVNPTDAHNPFGVAPDNTVRNLTCTGAPAASANMFQGTNNQGRFLPPPPSGFSEWTYANDANGVRIYITAPNDSTDMDALTRIMNKFATCQADLNYGGCGANCLTVWVQRNACP